jgi:hypothetical protein
MAAQVKQATHYLFYGEPFAEPFAVDTMSELWDFAITAELRGYACHAVVVFTDGSTQAVAL